MAALLPSYPLLPSYHGTAVALRGPKQMWRGVILRGPSGAGKSQLALRLLDRGDAVLIADDQILLSLSEQQELLAFCPAPLAGLLEVRGVGIMRFPHREGLRIHLVVDLNHKEKSERLPEIGPCPDLHQKYGASVPRLTLNPFEVATDAKLRLVLSDNFPTMCMNDHDLPSMMGDFSES